MESYFEFDRGIVYIGAYCGTEYIGTFSDLAMLDRTFPTLQVSINLDAKRATIFIWFEPYTMKGLIIRIGPVIRDIAMPTRLVVDRMTSGVL